MAEENLQIIRDNIFEVDFGEVIKADWIKKVADFFTVSNPTFEGCYEFFGEVARASGKCIDLKLHNFVPAPPPNFEMKIIVHNDEDAGQEGNDDEWQLHGFYVIEADDNTYMNIEGVDLRVKFNHMYFLPSRAIYKYIKGSNIKVVTMKWKLREFPRYKDTMKQWR